MELKSKKNLDILVFECGLQPKEPIIDPEIEAGECLFSTSFAFGAESISIGIEEEDSLFQRANANINLPNRYAKEGKIDYNNHHLIKSSDTGIKVSLPPLKVGELVQIQFIVAGGVDPLANWYAVDAYEKNILLQAGIV